MCKMNNTRYKRKRKCDKFTPGPPKDTPDSVDLYFKQFFNNGKFKEKEETVQTRNALDNNNDKGPQFFLKVNFHID